MNTQQRGVYQPATDNIPIYDLSDEEMEEEEHSRLPLLIVIALLVLAAFAGVVWLAYNQGVERGRSGAAIVISAPDGPVRTAPADSAGSAPPYTGLKVYGQALPPDQEAQASALAPAQDNDIAAPSTASAPAKPAVTSDAPPVRLNPETKNVVASAPPAAAATVPAPAPAPVKQVAQTPPSVQPTAIANVVTAPAAPTALTASAVSAVSGKAVLQIGAYETPEIANGAWAAFKARHASVAGKLSQDVQKADLGAKGTWYRLRVGPFADKSAANTACEQLRSEGATCFVAAP
ncbi:MAG TPA: SPOR domain-containing protein [Micropepsaceae bacterium]|jgi:cell division protein FtsN|nr:SPOR domain-containing protein [Micropepsaceae bacterium]